MESATMLHLPTCVETRRRSFVFLEVLDVDVTGGELSGDGGVAMVEEEAGAGVQGGDLIHLRGGEFEVENVEVFLHAFGANGFRDHDDVALDEPPQHHLADGLVVGSADGRQGRIGEHVVAPFGKRTPRFMVDPVVGHHLVINRALVVDMRLDLVHRRGDVVVDDQVDQAVWMEVGHADGSGPPV